MQPSDVAPHAFVVTGQHGHSLLMAAANDAERDEWLTQIRKLVHRRFFHAQKARGALDLRSAVAVRKSSAPVLPPYALDVCTSATATSPARVFTLLPETHEEQLRWVCVLSQAMGVARVWHACGRA